MAAAAPSPLASSVEKTNGAKLSRLLIDGGTTVLRTVFDSYHPPANLAADLNANYPILNKLLKKKVLRTAQWDQLFPSTGVTPDSNTFDITLLFLLLINICGLSPPASGWHTKPPPSNTSLEANLARIKFFRNELYGHVSTTGVDTPTFTSLWQEISAVLVSLGLDQLEIDRLKAEHCGEEDFIDVLLDWADSENDLKSQLKEVHKDVRQCQTEIQRSVEKVHQTQLEDRKTLQDSISKHGTLQAGLREVKQEFENLKIKREIDGTDEVLRKLAKSEFKGDIEYHAEKFQEGTREWIFKKVEDWLDDRSSTNRVMVISGNAGMGKSVISAVICKRMQDAGRLSGSHFCQHNNVRYRKPQLMLQSLACHLSQALPEYKNALVEQLSRNLGVELNSMGVEELFALLFKEPLSTATDPGRNILMVIDGLDESEYQRRSELLDVIANHFCKLPKWIRFFVTTRSEIDILDSLKHLQPMQLEDQEENFRDIQLFFEMQLSHEIEEDDLLKKVVKKSEGLFLYAYFLIDFIQNNVSLLTLAQLENNLPLGISSVYLSHFKRLEDELCKELKIEEEQVFRFLCALSASREPLPVAFASKILIPSGRSSAAQRRVNKVISCISTLLPVRDGRLHFFHKSVKDWLTNTSYYGQHDFTVNEKEGREILFKLCTTELDSIKRKGVHGTQLSDTEKYALEEFGESSRPYKVEQLVNMDFSPRTPTVIGTSQGSPAQGNPGTSDTALRVTLLASEWSSSMGGLSTINRQLAILLAKHMQVEVTLLVPQFACCEEEKRAARSHNVAIREAERLPGYDSLDWLSFPPNDLAIDIVLGHGGKLGKQAQVIRESHSCKWVQVVHTSPEELGMYKNYPRAISKGEEKNITEVDLCNLADLVVAVGPKLTRAYSSYLRSCKEHQDIIQLTPGTFSEFAVIKQATNESDEFKVLTFGRGDPEDFSLKGYDIAAKAIVELRDRLYCLIFVGAPDGKQEEIAEKLLQSGISKDQLIVRKFVRSKERLKELFCEVDLVIMPSRTEGFGLTALEALSAGLPILVSGNSGFADALCALPSGTPFVVESADPKEWADAIAAVRLKDRAERLREIQRLRTCYEEHYSWERQCEALVQKMGSMFHD